jgi:hypothetical protein
MANILTIPESGIYFDSGDPCSGITPILTGNASGVAIQYDGYAGILVNSSATGANYLDRFSVEGSNGRLFGVTDETTGVIFSVNDAAGLPIIEVESTSEYDKITIGEYATDALVISGSSVKVTGSNVVTEGYLTDGGYLTSLTETYSTASELLAALLTVDGTGSNLDADKLDSQESSYYLNYSNFTNTPTIPSAANNATITLLGGSGITTSIGDFTTNQSANETLTISHSDTSSQASVDNNNGTVIQDVFLDTYGHITGIGSTNLDSRYNNYSLPSGTSSVRGGFKIGYSENGKNYPVEVLSEQMFVNVPWTDANTTYSVGSGISLSGTTFSVAAGGGLTQTATGLSHTDTSSQASVDNNNGTVIQDVFLDTYGHITGIGSTNLDSRYNNYSLPSGTSSVRGGFKIGYSENGKNYPVEVLSEQMFVNVPWTDANTVYTHPTQTALTVDVNANSGATILSTLDIVVNTLGHVTSASSTTRTLTAANLGLGSLASLSSVNAATITDNSVGAAELNVVGNGTNTQFLRSDADGTFTWAVPTDTNTTYGVGNGISLSGTTFSVAAGGGLTQTATGLSHTDTSSQASVNNSNGTVIQDVFLDTYGHITGIGSTNLDSRYNNYSLPAGTSSERGGFKIGYSENGKNYPVEVSSEQMFVSVPWTDANTVYTHPTQTALTVDVNANSGATILSTLDIVVNTLGHVTSASSTTRTLTAANLGLGSLASLSSVNAATITDNSVGAAELNVVGNGTATQFLRSDTDGSFTWAVPTDTNTTYSAGSGISLSGTTFSVAAGGGLTQTATGLSHTDTSSQASVDNNNGTVIQDVFLDTYGHITGIGSTNLDSRYNNYSLPSGTSSVRGGFKIGYSENGKNYPVEVLSEQMFVNVPWTDANTTYSVGSGISLSGTTFSVAAGGGLTQTATGLSHTDTSSQASVDNNNGTVIQDVFLDTYGHITGIGSTNLDSRYNNYSLPSGTSSVRGGFKIGYSENGKNYPVEVLSEQMFVNVPWTDANTTYSVGSGISLSGTTFSVAAGGGLTQTATGLSHTDTSSQASVDNNNGTVIQDVFLDTYGHITGIGSTNLDSRYNNYSLPSGTSSGRGGFKIGYSENGKNYPVEVLSEQMFVNVPWTDANTVYTHPTQTALTVDVNANSGATILSTLDIVVNTLGHVTSASSTTRTLTAANLGLGSLASLSSVNAATITDNSVGAAELNVVGNGTNTQFLRSDADGTFTWAVPTDTNTTYGVGNGISLSGTTFSVAAGGGLTQTATGLSHTDTSSQASVDNNNGTVIQDVFLDTYGHITGIGSTNLDSRYNNYSLPAGTSSERGGFKIGYSENGKNYPVEVSSEQMFVSVPWTDANTVYTHPTQTALTVDVNANSGATILSTLDIVVNTLGHVTSASSTTRTLTAANLGLGSLASLSSVNAATITDNSVGAAELNVVGNGTNTQFLRSDADGTFTWAVPTDTNTTYSAGSGISLSGTTFSVAAGGGLTQTATGLSHTDTSSQASVDNNNGTVIQDVFLDTYGHITGIGSTNLDSRYNNYSLPSGTSSVRGGFKIGYSENGKNYPVEVLSEQMFVNVPWTDANTVYTHPTQSALTVDVNANSAATILSTLDIAVNTLGHVTSASSTTRTLTAANLGITAPNAPTSVTSTIVGQTIDLTFNESSTSSIDAYLVYSSVDGSDYGLIQVIPPADFSSTMSVIDTAFTHTGTQAYRVYAMKYGILSSAGTASVSYTVSSAEPSNVEVINMNNAYYVQWNPPSTNDRFVTSYNVFKHEASTAGALLRASASLVYSGLNTNYMYQINGNNNNNFHQFWVETTIA